MGAAKSGVDRLPMNRKYFDNNFSKIGSEP
jgi:hypothetical protein